MYNVFDILSSDCQPIQDNSVLDNSLNTNDLNNDDQVAQVQRYVTVLDELKTRLNGVKNRYGIFCIHNRKKMTAIHYKFDSYIRLLKWISSNHGYNFDKLGLKIYQMVRWIIHRPEQVNHSTTIYHLKSATKCKFSADKVLYHLTQINGRQMIKYAILSAVFCSAKELRYQDDGDCNLFIDEAGSDRVDNNQEQECVGRKLKNMGTVFDRLSIDGCAIFKIYTWFKLDTQLFIQTAVDNFQEVVVFKPLVSKSASSERYLICMGFNGKRMFSDAVDVDLMEKLVTIESDMQERQIPALHRMMQGGPSVTFTNEEMTSMWLSL